MTIIAGVDISKHQFDVYLLMETGEGQYQTFPNTQSGLNKLHRWLKKSEAKTAHIS